MKFYYQGQLLRTSKTHDYKYAVLRDRKGGTYRVWGLSSTLEGANKAMREASRYYADMRIVEVEKK